MTYLIDENLSFKIAQSLKALDNDVHHVRDHFPSQTPDETIFDFLVRKDWVLITQDKKMRTRKHQLQAMLDKGVGAFIFTGRADKNLTQQAVMILERMGEFEKLAQKTKRPFIFSVPDRGKIKPLV